MLGSQRYVALALVLSVGLAATACIRVYQRMPIQHAVLYAVETDSNPIMRAVGSAKIRNIQTCPDRAFTGPSSPLSFVVSVMDEPSIDQERARTVFEHFQTVGCDVNRVKRGEAPIHAAVVFRNARLVSYLLTQGADPYVRMTLPHRHSGLDAFQLLTVLCAKSPKGCTETRAVLDRLTRTEMSQRN